MGMNVHRILLCRPISPKLSCSVKVRKKNELKGCFCEATVDDV